MDTWFWTAFCCFFFGLGCFGLGFWIGTSIKVESLQKALSAESDEIWRRGR